MNWYTTSTFYTKQKNSNMMNFLKDLVKVYTSGLALVSLILAALPLILFLALLLGYALKFVVKLFMYGYN